MDENELLIRHALAWAQKRKQSLNRDLLETTLSLRDFHDGQRPQEWPLGSVEHLMLVRWPSHGPDAPDVDALVATLDSFWRFLRGTGRMASVSATPKDLTKEARRAASGMRAACADPSRHGASKSLLQFGQEIGVSLDDVESTEEMNERLQLIMNRWNALPDDERLARSPGVSAHQGSRPGQSITEFVGEMASADDPLDMPRDEHGNVMPADVGEVAADVRASAYVQQCRRLMQWLGAGRQVTPKQVLRLAPAREAYAELDLWEWERADNSLTRAMMGAPLIDDSPENDRQHKEVAMQSFRSAADCWPLDRLWLPCDECALIEFGKTKAVSLWTEPTTDEQWQDLGTRLLVALVSHLTVWSREQVLGTLLMLLGPTRRDGISLGEVQEWWWNHPDNFYRQWPGQNENTGSVRAESDAWMLAGLHHMSDTGVWRQDGEVLHPTALGHDVTLLVARDIEMGIIDQ